MAASGPQEEMLLSYEDFAKLARTFGETEMRGPSLRAEFDGLLRSSGRAPAGEKTLTFEDFYSWWLGRQSAAGGTSKLLERASAKLAAIAAGPLPASPAAAPVEWEAAAMAEAAAAQVVARKNPVPRRARPTKPARTAAAPASAAPPRNARPAWKTTGAVPRPTSPTSFSSDRERPVRLQTSRTSPVEWERPWREVPRASPVRARTSSSDVAAPRAVRAAAKAVRAVASSHTSSCASPRAQVVGRGRSPRRRPPAWRSSISPDSRPVSPQVQRGTSSLPRRIHEDDTARVRRVSRQPQEQLHRPTADEYRMFLQQVDALAYQSALARLGADSLLSLAGMSTMQLIDAGMGLSLRNRVRDALAARGIAPPTDDRCLDLPHDADAEDEVETMVGPADRVQTERIADPRKQIHDLPDVSSPSRGRIRVMHRSPSLAQDVHGVGSGAPRAELHQRGTGRSPSRELAPPSRAITAQQGRLNQRHPVSQALPRVDTVSSAQKSNPTHDIDQVLRPGWEVHSSTRTGQQYYYNPATGESTYSMPHITARATSVVVSTTHPHEAQRPRTTPEVQHTAQFSATPTLDEPRDQGSSTAEMQKQAVDMRRALAEIAALMAQHPENVELRGMMVDTTAALTLLEQKLHRMPPLDPPPQSQSQPQPQPQPQSELELEPEAEPEPSGEIQSEVAHVETPVVDRTGAPADDSAYDGAESHLAALAALLEEKQAALTALLQKTDGTENGTAAQDQQLESLLKQVEALDALLGTAC